MIKKLLIVSILTMFPTVSYAIDCPNMYFDGNYPQIQNTFEKEYVQQDCHKEFSNGYTEQGNMNLWSAEHLTRKQIENSENISRKGKFNYKDPIIKSYSNSGYDRGHMAPSGDASTLESQEETFTWKNIVPQNHKLNGGKWKKIEENTRYFAKKYGEVYVVTGGYFDKINTIGEENILVPEEVWKAILIPSKNIALVYSCKNNSLQKCTSETLNEFEGRTGITPFPALKSHI